jgi:MoaA/NifB/PqqE/SkfB family radical SAM enzyme
MRDRHRIDSEKISLHPARVARWLAARDKWELARDVFPIYVEVSPVGFCNHSCTFCGVDYMLDRPDKGRLAPEVLDAMLADMHRHGVLSVMFAGAGEPLIHKHLPKAIVNADSVGLDMAITTNGVLLSEAVSRQILGLEHLRWIKVSINAGDRDVYSKIHRTKPEDFDRVLANLTAAARVREELGGRCTLGAQMVALPEGHPNESESFPSNLETAEPLIHRLKETGIDYVVIKPYSQHLMSQDTRFYAGVRYPDARAWANALEALSTDRFEVVVRTNTMAELDRGGRGYDRCHATPFHWAYVEADGEVWGCSAYLGRREGDKTWGDDRFRYGNVNAASFSEIWRGDRRRDCWDYVRTKLDISECRLNCRMHQVNLHLESVADPGPHASFI